MRRRLYSDVDKINVIRKLYEEKRIISRELGIKYDEKEVYTILNEQFDEVDNVKNLGELKTKISPTPHNNYQKYIDYINEIINNFDNKNNSEDFLIAKPLDVKKSWDNYKKSKSLLHNIAL